MFFLELGQFVTAAEALYQGHGAGLCRGFCEACLAGQMRGDGAVDNGQSALAMTLGLLANRNLSGNGTLNTHWRMG